MICIELISATFSFVQKAFLVGLSMGLAVNVYVCFFPHKLLLLELIKQSENKQNIF